MRPNFFKKYSHPAFSPLSTSFLSKISRLNQPPTPIFDRRIHCSLVESAYQYPVSFDGHGKIGLLGRNFETQHVNFAYSAKLFPTNLKSGCFDYRSSPRLPVVDSLLNRAFAYQSYFSLENTAIIYVHHALNTSINTIEAMLKLQANPANIFILGKSYSESSSVVEEIKQLGVRYQNCSKQRGVGTFCNNFNRDVDWVWYQVVEQISRDKNINKLLVLDHGGRMLSHVPEEELDQLGVRVIGIEKTTAGLIELRKNGFPHLPIINVAKCAAKTIFESPMISDAVMKKLPAIESRSEKKTVCGIIGYGAIGKAIAQKLISSGFIVIVYEQNPFSSVAFPEVKRVETLAALIAESEYIFGCTGRDVFQDRNLLELVNITLRKKILISCSSEDKEFLSLLLQIREKNEGENYINPLKDITYVNELGGEIRLLRGGFPINFDNSEESVPADEIQLTRGLVLGAILQALKFFNSSEISYKATKLYKLDSNIQQFVVDRWLENQSKYSFPKEVVDDFKNKDWVSKHSDGMSINCDFFEEFSLEKEACLEATPQYSF